METYLGGVLSFAITIFGIRLLLPVARRYHLVDRTGGHKIHEREVPVIGGLLMYAALVICLIWFLVFDLVEPELIMVFAGAGMVVVVGFIDDIRRVSVRSRLLAQITASMFVAVGAGCVLTDFGRLVSPQMLTLGVLSIPMTVFTITGGMNAMNMSDGLDGLAGGLALITLSSLLLVSLVAGGTESLPMLIAIIGAIAGFLVFNFRWRGRSGAHVFMGDAGSMLLGFLISCLLIDLASGPQRAMTPVTALWIFAVPLLDTFRLILLRLMDGRSPFSAGQDHLHHILLKTGMSVPTTVYTLLGLQVLCSAVGLIGLYAGIEERYLFFAALIFFACFFLFLSDTDKAALRLQRLARHTS